MNIENMINIMNKRSKKESQQLTANDTNEVFEKNNYDKFIEKVDHENTIPLNSATIYSGIGNCVESLITDFPIQQTRENNESMYLNHASVNDFNKSLEQDKYFARLMNRNNSIIASIQCVNYLLDMTYNNFNSITSNGQFAKLGLFNYFPKLRYNVLTKLDNEKDNIRFIIEGILISSTGIRGFYKESELNKRNILVYYASQLSNMILTILSGVLNYSVDEELAKWQDNSGLFKFLGEHNVHPFLTQLYESKSYDFRSQCTVFVKMLLRQDLEVLEEYIYNCCSDVSFSIFTNIGTFIDNPLSRLSPEEMRSNYNEDMF